MLANLPPQVSALARGELESLLKGVSLYQEAAYRRLQEDAPVVWRKGSARLLDYSGGNGSQATILFVPSLINRYYILDLEPGRSFVRHLAGEGLHSLVLDWGEPGERERQYDCAAYVTEQLLPAIRFATETTGGPVVLAGYCMGGVLALAAALLVQKQVAGLALLATPWDFHAPDMAAPRLDPDMMRRMENWLDSLEVFPPQLLQLLFYWPDPWLFKHKFCRLAGLSPGSSAFREFIALERWVNDGVPLAKGVARDCLLAWGQRNVLASGKWQVAGKALHPEKYKGPAFVAAPALDQIVPPGCALALAGRLKNVTLCEPSSGHVGMMVGRRAKKELWEPFVDFLTYNL